MLLRTRILPIVVGIGVLSYSGSGACSLQCAYSLLWGKCTDGRHKEAIREYGEPLPGADRERLDLVQDPAWSHNGRRAPVLVRFSLSKVPSNKCLKTD